MAQVRQNGELSLMNAVISEVFRARSSASVSPLFQGRWCVHCQANTAHTGQSSPDSGLIFRMNSLEPVEGVPFSRRGRPSRTPRNPRNCHLHGGSERGPRVVQRYLAHKKTHPPATLPHICRSIPRVLGGSQGVERFLMSEVPL